MKRYSWIIFVFRMSPQKFCGEGHSDVKYSLFHHKIEWKRKQMKPDFQFYSLWLIYFFIEWTQYSSHFLPKVDFCCGANQLDLNRYIHCSTCILLRGAHWQPWLMSTNISKGHLHQWDSMNGATWSTCAIDTKINERKEAINDFGDRWYNYSSIHMSWLTLLTHKQTDTLIATPHISIFKTQPAMFEIMCKKTQLIEWNCIKLNVFLFVVASIPYMFKINLFCFLDF